MGNYSLLNGDFTINRSFKGLNSGAESPHFVVLKQFILNSGSGFLMEGNRAERVSHLIRKEVAEMLTRDVKDPRIGMVSITDVEVSRDLRHAYIYYSRLGTEKEIEGSAIGLKRATKFIQGQLGRRLNLRYTPIIQFRFDNSLEYGSRIDKILHTISMPQDKNSEDQE